MNKVEGGITAREKRFVQAYCAANFNGTRAALEINPAYSVASASSWASNRLKSPRVQEYLRSHLEDVLGPYRETLQYQLMDTYFRRAFYNVADFVDENGCLAKPLAEYGKDAVVIDQIVRKETKDSVYTQVQLADRDKALEALSRIIELVKPEERNVRVVVLAGGDMTPDQWSARFDAKTKMAELAEAPEEKCDE